VGQYLNPDDVRASFVEPLKNLWQDFHKACERWEQASRAGSIAREDLFLNDATAALSLGTLRKFQREINGKLEDAIAGVYRYREAERSRKVRRRVARATN
jgi:hypothetical protein